MAEENDLAQVRAELRQAVRGLDDAASKVVLAIDHAEVLLRGGRLTRLTTPAEELPRFLRE